MSEINAEKNIYLFTHGRMDLEEKATNILIDKGFSRDKIIMASPNKIGEVDEYMAMLWRPPTPDHIKFQKITKVEQVEPAKMIGLWKGVTAEDLFTINLV